MTRSNNPIIEQERRRKISETMKAKGIKPVPHKSWNKGKTRKEDPRIAQPWLHKKRPEMRNVKGFSKWKGGVSRMWARTQVNKISCEYCGSNRNLYIHHIDLNERNNLISNLIVLCPSCHRKLHNQIKRQGKI